MSLDVDNEVINKLMHQEMQAAVSVFVKERSMRIESVVQTLIKENLKDEARLQVSNHVQEALRQTHIANEVGKMIRDAVREEVAKTINSWLTGDNKQAMAALVDGRVDNYIRDRTESKVEHWLEAKSKLKMAKIVADRVDAYIDRVVVKKEVERSVSDAKATKEPESAANQSRRGNDGSPVLGVPAVEPAACESQVGSDQQACVERLQETQPER
jgi:hypothetical protein